MIKKINSSSIKLFTLYKAQNPRLHVLDRGPHKTVADLLKCIGLERPYNNDVLLKRFQANAATSCKLSTKLKLGDAIYYNVGENYIARPSEHKQMACINIGHGKLQNDDCKHAIKGEVQSENSDLKSERKEQKEDYPNKDIKDDKREKLRKKQDVRGLIEAAYLDAFL